MEIPVLHSSCSVPHMVLNLYQWRYNSQTDNLVDNCCTACQRTNTCRPVSVFCVLSLLHPPRFLTNGSRDAFAAEGVRPIFTTHCPTKGD